GDTYFGQQLRSKSLLVSYTDSDILEIVHKNIAHSDAEDLADPRSNDPVAAFFGPLSRVTHPTTGDEEEVAAQAPGWKRSARRHRTPSIRFVPCSSLGLLQIFRLPAEHPLVQATPVTPARTALDATRL